MAKILSHPFRLAANGSIATVEQDTEQADAEQIALLAMTVRGERPTVPGFGVSDPVFAGFPIDELAAGVVLFGPPVEIEQLEVRAGSDTTQLVDITFS